jgi:type IV pilus assembly protein PilC
VAAEVGDTTGRLAACLRRTDQDRLAGVWLEVLPRVLYPLLLLVFIGGITTFLAVMVVPKFKKIFDDFKESLPPVTERLIAVMMAFADYAWLIVLAAIGVFVATAWLVFSPSTRWHVPLVGRLFRWETQGLVLRMLGALFEVGRPAPEALGLLADAPDLPNVARRRLYRAKWAIERGEPLAESLYQAGLLPASMAPLVTAAERTQSLPFALTELGNLLAGKAVRMARRASLVIGPVLVVAIGALVGLIVVGMFTPLIQLLTRMSV